MGCLFDSPDEGGYGSGGYGSYEEEDVLEVGTGVIFKDTIRGVWDMGNVRGRSRGGYSITPLFNFGQDVVQTDDRTSAVPMEQDVEFVFNIVSEVIGTGVLVMKKQEPNEPARRVAFHDMNFNLRHQGTMFIELGNMRKLKLKFKPPPVHGVEQKKYWVLILLQKDARNFMSVGSQPRTHMYATNPIPEQFLGQNEIILENQKPKATTWKGGPLPQGWIQENDPTSGQYFFVNTANGQVSWSPPPMILPQKPKQKYKYPKDPELDQVAESVQWNGADTRQPNYRNCNQICVCQLGTLFVVRGSNITGKWRVVRRGLKLTWSNHSGRGDPKYNKITTSMASLPELLMSPAPAPPIQGASAPMGQPMQGSAPPMGQPIQGASAPYQDPHAIGQQPVGPSYGAQPQVGGPQVYQPPHQADYSQPPSQQVAPAYGVGAPPSGYQAPPTYGVSGAPSYQAPPGPYQAPAGPYNQAPPGPYNQAPPGPYQAPSGPSYQQPPGPSYAAPPSGQPQYGQPQYGQPQYGQPQYGQPQYGQPQYGQPQYGQPEYGQPQYGQPQYGQAPGGYQQQPTFQPMPTPVGGWAPPSSEPPKRSNKQLKYAAVAVGGAVALGGGMYLAHEWMEHQEKEERRRQERMFNMFSNNMNSNREYSDSSDYWRREAQRAERRQRQAEQKLRAAQQQNNELKDEEALSAEAEPMEMDDMEMEDYDDEEEAEEEEEEAEDDGAEEAQDDEAEEAPEEEEEAPEDEEVPEVEAVEDGGEEKGPAENEEAEEYMAAGAGPWDFDDPPSDGEGKKIQTQQKEQVQDVLTNASKASKDVAIEVQEYDLSSNDVAIKVKKSKRERIQEYMDKNAFCKQSYKTSSFWLRTDKEVGKDAIGVVTQLSMDRLPMLKAMICSWDGYISAAVYITNKEEDLPKLKKVFDYAEMEMSTSLDLHLLFSSDEGDSYYPINNLRNLALKEVRSKYVFLLDIDFTISAGLSPDTTTQMKEMLNSGRKALVVPALEPIGCYGRAGEDLTPQDIDICMKQGTVVPFHTQHFAAGHSATNLDRWVKATAPFQVQYEHCYEPYVIMRKDQVPEYDERFRGYGMNKISHLMQVSTNTDFHVLPNVYVMSIRHEKSVDWKKTFRGDKKRERLIEMQALFNIFKNELFSKAEKQVEKTKKSQTYNILSTAVRAVSFMALVAIGKSVITA